MVKRSLSIVLSGVTSIVAVVTLLVGCQQATTQTHTETSTQNPSTTTSHSQVESKKQTSGEKKSYKPNDEDGPVPTVDITAPEGENLINILAWNVESDGNDPKSIAEQIKGMKGYHLFAFSEVRGKPSQEIYEEALKHHWENCETILSRTGRQDRLMYGFDADVFEVIEVEELNDLNIDGKYRAPHVLTIKHKPTDQVFKIVNNHLARGNARNRQKQADGLREWAREQTLPVVGVGDYNFDYVFATKKGNQGFVNFMRDGIWEWVEPEELIDSNYYDGDGDKIDDYPGSILDFMFVAGPAKDWETSCKVIQWEGDFPDNANTSDHRPLELSIKIK